MELLTVTIPVSSMSSVIKVSYFSADAQSCCPRQDFYLFWRLAASPTASGNTNLRVLKSATHISVSTWCEEPTHWKRPWCWERLRVGREGDDRGWDGWMASPTQWTWVWANSGSWWWSGKPDVLGFMGSQRVKTRLRGWTELNWTEEWAVESLSY